MNPSFRVHQTFTFLQIISSENRACDSAWAASNIPVLTVYGDIQYCSGRAPWQPTHTTVTLHCSSGGMADELTGLYVVNGEQKTENHSIV